MILFGIAQLLAKIEAGINHKCSIRLKVVNVGLQIDILFTCTFDKRDRELHDCWSWGQMANVKDDNILINPLIESVNRYIRDLYREFCAKETGE